MYNNKKATPNEVAFYLFRIFDNVEGDITNALKYRWIVNPTEQDYK